MSVGDSVPIIVSLLERFQDDRQTANWKAMRDLLHPEARLESLAAPGRVLTNRELVDAVQQATRDGLYTVRQWQVNSIDTHAAIAEGRVRYRVGKAALTDEQRVWANTERDGLIWRMRIFRSRDQAAACYRTYGLDLGI